MIYFLTVSFVEGGGVDGGFIAAGPIKTALEGHSF